MRLILIWSGCAPPHVQLYKISKTLFSIEVAGSFCTTFKNFKNPFFNRSSVDTTMYNELPERR